MHPKTGSRIAATLFAGALTFIPLAAARAQDSPAAAPPPAATPAPQPQQSTSQNSRASENSPTGFAAGVVRTSDGAPVPGASLRLVNTDTQKAYVSWTDESGKFQFAALPAGHYSVEASQLGFSTASLQIELGDGPPPPPLQLTLRVATLAELSAPGASQRPGGGRRFGQGPPGSGGANGGNAQNGSPGATGNGANGNGANGNRPGGGRGNRGQPLSPGLMNALQQGMGGFQQTDLTGDAAQGEAGIGGAGAGAAEANLGGAGGGSSDSFLLQGTVGQGLSSGGFGGPGGVPGALAFAQNQGMPGQPGQPGQAGNGNPFAGVQGAGGPGDAGAFGLGGLFGGGPGGGGGRGGPGGAGGGAGRAQGIRLLRQNVNRVRFTLFDRYTNSAFDAKPFSITHTPEKQIGAYDERVGGTVGGPLKIPRIYNGSDKTYFFVNYQHEIAKNPVNTFSTVPTAAERAGCFPSGSVDMPFSTTPYTDPGSCGVGAVQVPINPAAAGLLAFIPMPNVTATSGVTGGLAQNYLLQATTPLNSDILSTHVLHTINSKWNWNAGYNISSTRINTLSNFADIGGNQSTLNQSVQLGLSHNWSPRLVETESLTWSRNRIKLLSDNSFGTDIAAELGINGVSTEPIDFGIPLISFTDLSGINDPIPALARNQTLRFGDNLTWTHVKHTMTFGAELRRIDLNTQSNPNPRGGFVFTGLATGNDFADFLVGDPFTTTEQFGNPNLYLRSWGFAAYAQDDFRVSKTFTLQYGLRYEFATPPVELDNNLVNLDITNLSDVTQVGRVDGLTPAGLPRALIHGNYGNLEPRFGFAWQPKFIKKRTVVRGGYSIFYNEAIYNTLARELAFQAPVDTVQTLTTTSTAPLTLQNGFTGGSSTGVTIPNTESVDPNYKNGYAQIWNLGLETSITQNWILDLTYTGTKGTDLDILRAPNRAPLGTPSDEIQAFRVDPLATGFTFDQSGANSIYNALQVRLVHRFTHGVLLQGIYTYGKSLDDSSSVGGAGGSGTVEQQDGNLHAEYGLSTFDIRHQLRAVSMWELPLGQRYRYMNHGWEEKLFGDWRLQNIVTWQTGTPLTVLLGGVASDNGTGANFSLRPNITGNPNLGICGGPTSAFFNTGVFTLPVDSSGNLAYGDEPRGAVEGPCTFNWNLSLAKTFRFGPERRHQLNLSWQISNLTNTPNYNSVGTTLPCFPPAGSSGTVNPADLQCGVNASPSGEHSLFGLITGAGNMRTMAGQLRFNW
jgi:trimeric autotransporter adhesin